MKKALLALFALHLLRLLLAPTFELAPQEAYYALYAQHPALSYFDHPPAIAWLLWPFLELLGRTALAPRLAVWLATLGTGFAFWALAGRVLPKARRTQAMVALGVSLLASVVGLIATPDVPLLLFWTLSLYFTHRAISGERRADWIAAGLLMGLAFDAKYTAVFLQAGLGLFLVISPRQRRWLRTPWPYLALLTAHGAMAPVYLWNATHGFASFLFQSAGRASSVHELGLLNFGKLVGTQSALLLPPLLVAIAWAVPRAALEVRRRSRSSRDDLLFLACFSLPLMALFTGLSFFALVKPNWLLPSYLAGTLLAARLVTGRWLAKAQVAVGLPVFALAALEVALYVVPIQSDDTWYGWKDLAGQVEQRAQATHADFVFSDDEYKTTAELRFYSDVPAFAGNAVGRRALQFDYLNEDLGALTGKDALFVDSAPRDDSPDRSGDRPEAVAARFEEVGELDPILVRRGDRVVRKFFVYQCRRYRRPATPGGRP